MRGEGTASSLVLRRYRGRFQQLVAQRKGGFDSLLAYTVQQYVPASVVTIIIEVKIRLHCVLNVCNGLQNIHFCMVSATVPGNLIGQERNIRRLEPYRRIIYSR